MSLLTEIYDWSVTLASWKSDVIRRLFLKQVLNASDFDDIYALLKSSKGIPDVQDRKAQPLSEGDIPKADSGAKKLTLLTLRDLKHVNRIAEGQKISFSQNGLTIIYGDNGTGKSGYSRVLKRACKARDITEDVLPNAFLSTTSSHIPEAVFDVELDGKKVTFNWSNVKPAPEELDSVCVFDSRCASSPLKNSSFSVTG